MTMEAVSKLIEERDELQRQVWALQANANAAAVGSSKLRRIMARTKITVPCVMVKPTKYEDLPLGWQERKEWVASVFLSDAEVDLFRDDYTHWLPFQWPEVRG
jgi:hypothetical protein